MTAAEARSPIPDAALALFGGKLRMGYIASRRPDEHLSVVPVGVMIRDGFVRISSPAETFKIRNLAHDPHIAVCVPDPADGRRYLMIRGLAEVTEDGDLAFMDWLARTHMDLPAHPRENPVVPRMVITIRSAHFIMGSTFGDH